MSAKKTRKSKQFRVATEGATVDGRTIKREWIQQMADGYNVATYHAGVNLEHIRGLIPDSPFKNYGTVDALSAAENDNGELQLFAVISPTDDLVKMNQAKQKLFTSAEINPNFAGTGKAYLVGLAVTDSPASLGTDMLAFTASNPLGSPLTARKQHPDNFFSVGVEAALEFEETDDAPGILDRITAIFSTKGKADEKRFGDIERAIEEVAEHGQALGARATHQFQQLEQNATTAKQRADDIDQRLKALETTFSTTPAATRNRPVATGDSDVLTEF